MTIDMAQMVAAAQQGLSKEEILAAHPNDAQIDMVQWLTDNVMSKHREYTGGLTDEEKQGIATKMAYWCRLFYSQGALKFQQAYEEKVKKLATKRAEERASGKRIIERQGLFVPFKYKGKTK